MVIFWPTVRINSFEKITTLSILEDSIDNVVDIINDNGSFKNHWVVQEMINQRPNQ